MFSLHRLDVWFFEKVDFYLYFCNTLPIFLTINYFIICLIILFFNFLNITVTYNIRSVILNIYWLFVFLLWIIFFYKFYINFRILNCTLNTTIIEWFRNNGLWNITLFGDTLILLCITTLIISWIFLSERYLQSKPLYGVYFFIFVIFTINMVYTNNLFIMFMFFELIFLPSLFFVYLLGYSKKVEKTIKYLLIWTLSGSFIALTGIVYLYVNYLSLNYYFIMNQKLNNFESNILILLFFIGFGVKIPLWPFHYWLTKVHVEAPTGFSIFLSGYLVKTALYCLIILLNIIKYNDIIYVFLTIIIWGVIESSIRMWTSTDIKRLIAFATIQEMNIILIFSIIANNTNYQFLNMFVLVHGLLSALLFFLIDQIQKRYYTRNLVSIAGLSYICSFLSIIMWYALLIFRGFPVFIKFFLEWELLNLLFEHYSIFGVLIFFIFTVFAVLGFARIWLIILYGQPTKNLINYVDILKTDKLISLLIIFFLNSLVFFIFLFKWVVLHLKILKWIKEISRL